MFLSLPPIRWHMISVWPVTSDIHLDGLIKVGSVRLLFVNLFFVPLQLISILWEVLSNYVNILLLIKLSINLSVYLFICTDTWSILFYGHNLLLALYSFQLATILARGSHIRLAPGSFGHILHEHFRFLAQQLLFHRVLPCPQPWNQPCLPVSFSKERDLKVCTRCVHHYWKFAISRLIKLLSRQS